MRNLHKIARRVTATVLESICKDELHTLWFENEQGDKWVPDLANWQGMPPDKQDFIYQHSRFPTSLRETVLRVKEDGGSETVCAGESSWSEDLALALVKRGFTLSEAIIVAATACERCMNVLADECGLTWGYAYGSEEYRTSNTCCEFCRPEGPRAS